MFLKIGNITFKVFGVQIANFRSQTRHQRLGGALLQSISVILRPSNSFDCLESKRTFVERLKSSLLVFVSQNYDQNCKSYLNYGAPIHLRSQNPEIFFKK